MQLYMQSSQTFSQFFYIRTYGTVRMSIHKKYSSSFHEFLFYDDVIRNFWSKKHAQSEHTVIP